MKKRILILCLVFLMILPHLVSCSAEQHDLLYEITVGPITYCVRGTRTQARRIVLKAGDEVLWSKSVSVSKRVGSMQGTYGFEVLDLNFDGYQDFMIADDIAGDAVSYACWLWDTNSGNYLQSEELSGLCNIQVNSEESSIFAFRHTYETEQAYLDAPAASISSDSATRYKWQDGKLIPSMQVSITYYSETEMYCYSVAYYDEELGKLGDSDDKWLTEDEYESYDMGFLYYFK